jgi:hypothetical protein
MGIFTTNIKANGEFTTFTNMVNAIEGLNCQNLPNLMPEKA